MRSCEFFINMVRNNPNKIPQVCEYYKKVSLDLAMRVRSPVWTKSSSPQTSTTPWHAGCRQTGLGKAKARKARAKVARLTPTTAKATGVRKLLSPLNRELQLDCPVPTVGAGVLPLRRQVQVSARPGAAAWRALRFPRTLVPNHPTFTRSQTRKGPCRKPVRPNTPNLCAAEPRGHRQDQRPKNFKQAERKGLSGAPEPGTGSEQRPAQGARQSVHPKPASSVVPPRFVRCNSPKRHSRTKAQARSPFDDLSPSFRSSMGFTRHC